MGLIKRWREAIRPRMASLGWAVASSLVGGGIGIAMATLWGRTVGW